MFAEITMYLHRRRTTTKKQTRREERETERRGATVDGVTAATSRPIRVSCSITQADQSVYSDQSSEGFRCAFVYRPGIRRYVGASLQWDQVRELDEISGKRVADVGRRNFRFRGLHLEPSRIAFELRPRYPPGRDNNLLETSSKITYYKYLSGGRLISWIVSRRIPVPQVHQLGISQFGTSLVHVARLVFVSS